MLTIVVGNVSSKIITTLPAAMTAALDDLLSYTLSGSFFILKRNPLGWDGKTHLFSTRTQLFPTGLLTKVVDFLKSNGHDVEIRDTRVFSTHPYNPLPYTNILRDFQQDVVNSCIKVHKRGIVKSPTGSGKTMMMMTIIAELNEPTIILVNKKDLLWQTKEKIKEYLNYDAGIIGDGKCQIDSKINICMIQSLCQLYKIKLEKRKKRVIDEDDFEEADSTKITNAREVMQMVENCKVLCIDEVHHLSSRTMYNFQKQCVNAAFRFGFSATPYTTSNKDLLLEAGIGPVVVAITLSDLIQKGFIAAPKFYWIKFSHRKYPYIDEDYQTLYKKAVVENEDRNGLIIDLALKAYKEDKRVLISVTSIEHGIRLENMLKMLIKDQKEFFIKGSTPAEVRNNFREALNHGNIKIVIATVIWNEAIDIPNLDVVINTKAQKSVIDFLQLVGRALRITATKKVCTIIDIYDYGCKYLTSHSKHRFDALEKEHLIEHKFIKLK